MKKRTNDQATRKRRAKLEAARYKRAQEHQTSLEDATSEAEEAEVTADFFDLLSKNDERAAAK